MSDAESKRAIEQALQVFAAQPLKAAATGLFNALGYASKKTLDLKPNGLEGFCEMFDPDGRLNRMQALGGDWLETELVFQLAAEDVSAAGQESLAFSSGRVDNAIIESYLVFALRLKAPHYTRTQLAGIAREINKLLPMPALLLFRHGDSLTLAVVNRRLGKRDESKDVLGKVTLIKDISIAAPHRAHVEILFDLSFAELLAAHRFTTFVGLHQVWTVTLDSAELNKRFYKEVANWYFWALQHVRFPDGAGSDKDVRNSTSVIRLITRLIFVWFIKEKGLVPEALFRERDVTELLQSLTPDESTYYKAILQNLFFATLNTEMNAAGKPPQRMFRRRAKQKGGRDQHYMVHNIYRYEDYFKDADAAIEVFAGIPFLNGGLFECLDKRTGTADKPVDIRIDGFSDRDDNPLSVPNFLFFGDEREVDLNEVYGTKSKRYKAQGIVNILNRYKFTVNENTPVEEEVALDPELLGRVFENLLASYNPETSTTARKQTGSFYTPREIVNYMVDEALIAYLETALSEPNAGTQPATGKPRNEVLALDAGPGDLALAAREPRPLLTPEGQRDEENALSARLRHLLAYNDEQQRFTPREVKRLIEAIDAVKILDPACGSGAFPMGVLHKLVFILGKLDPRNVQWEARQLERVIVLMREAASIPDAAFRERALADLETQQASIEEAFERNELDYGRKLFLIENCIFGVDIQPIAVQIAKLRFFVSLIVDQKLDDARENRGVRPLPNLETRFVAANTLIGIERPAQAMLRNPDIDEKVRELKIVRERYFTARTPATKDKYRKEDGRLRQELAELFKNDGFSPRAAKQLAGWNPYDQNASADFFDPEWMFGLMDGFSITIGNPPYVRADEQSEWNQLQRQKILASKQYETLWEKWDLFVPFIERAYKLLKHGGVTTLIVSDAFCHSKYAQKPQNWFRKNARILRLDFCGDLKIFDAAVHNLIYFLQRADGTRHTPERRVHHENFGDVTMLPSDEQAKLTNRAFFPEQSQHTGFSVSTLPIDSICYVSFGCRPNSDEKRAKKSFRSQTFRRASRRPSSHSWIRFSSPNALTPKPMWARLRPKLTI